MKLNINQRWKKYVARKSKIALFFDILFFVLVVAMLVPSTRKWIASTVTRYTMFPPRELDEVYYLTPAAYDWKLIDQKGDTVTLADFRGQVVFINLWATWCPPCVAEFPAIQRLYDGFGHKAKFILVSNESTQTIHRFMEKNGYSVPVFRSAGNMPGDFDSPSVPTTYLVSKEGRLVVKKVGAARWDALKVKRILDDLFNGKK